MASKWKDFKNNPRYEPLPLTSAEHLGDAEYRKKLDEVKGGYSKLTQAQLQEEYFTAKKHRDELNQAWKDVNLHLEAMSLLLIALLDSQGVTSVKTVTGETLYESIEPCVTVVDKDALHTYVDSQPDLQYLWGIHPQTLATYVKGLIEQGLDDQIPTSLKIWSKTSIRSRKAT